MSDRFGEAGEKFSRLLRIMARLRAPGGCPWDAKQTFDSIKSHTLEETYEVLDAIDRRDWDNLQEELGDLLLQPVFLAEIAACEQLFDINSSLTAIIEKLIRRHPHIFGDTTADTAEEVKKRWDEIKLTEKTKANQPRDTSVLDGVLRSLPALVEAEKISSKAAGLGFEWPAIDGVLEKLQEEAAELAEAQGNGRQEELEHELGDLLFTVVNIGRYLKLDSEQALRKANMRFRNRFSHVEKRLQGGAPASLASMEELWHEAKLLEQES